MKPHVSLIPAPLFVIPAQAGIPDTSSVPWTPAFAEVAA